MKKRAKKTFDDHCQSFIDSVEKEQVESPGLLFGGGIMDVFRDAAKTGKPLTVVRKA
jgi:hypothetical protein